MASTETQILDNIIASRRALLVGGGAAMAAFAMPGVASAAATVSSYTDADILNFALNLEYLEANFYYLAAFGTTIDKPTAASALLGGPTAAISLSGVTGSATSPTPATAGAVSYKPSPAVPWTLPAVKSYAIETAIEEGKHVSLLRSALGSAAAAQPAIDLTGGATYGSTAAWNTLASAAGLGATFDPFANDYNFLLAAYVFEDVGVTAYHGAAPLISQTSAGKSILSTAGGILAVEAYHAGLIRTTINNLDQASGLSLGLIAATQKISTLRTTLSKAAAPATNPYGAYQSYPDDIPITTLTTGSLAGGTAASLTTLVDADQTNLIAFTRTTTQVLNIVTGGNGASAGVAAKGVFFPSGLNGLFV